MGMKIIRYEFTPDGRLRILSTKSWHDFDGTIRWESSDGRSQRVGWRDDFYIELTPETEWVHVELISWTGMVEDSKTIFIGQAGVEWGSLLENLISRIGWKTVKLILIAGGIGMLLYFLLRVVERPLEYAGKAAKAAKYAYGKGREVLKKVKR